MRKSEYVRPMTYSDSTPSGRLDLFRPPARPRRGRAASVTLVSAISMIMLMGAGAVAFDLARLYNAQSQDQRIADASALAAAFAYNTTGSETTAQSAASSLATVNGATSATVTTTVVNAPDGSGNKAVEVNVTSTIPMTGFALFVTRQQGGLTLTVSATAYAEITSSAPPCIIALTSAGVTVNGGTTVTATSCAVGANGGISATNGATMTAAAFYSTGTITSTSSTLATSPTAGQSFPNSSAQTDPYNPANAATSPVFSRLSTVAALTTPTFPSVTAPSGGTAPSCPSGSTLTIGSGLTGTINPCNSVTTINFTGGAETDIGGSGISFYGNSITLNFAAGTYKINGILFDGGAVTVNLASGVTLYVWNGIKSDGPTVVFNGPGSYYVQGGIQNSGYGGLTFNNTNSASTTSTFTIAGGISSWNNSITFPDGTYTVTSGDSNHYGIDVVVGNITFGNGSFNIACGINIDAGKTLTVGNALNASAVFQIPVVGGTSPCSNSASNAINALGNVTLGSFTNFDINGAVTADAGVTLGAGTYTINGALNAAQGGGTTITGTGVSIITSGAVSFGAGYNAITLSAPTALSSATEGTASTVVLASEATTATVTAGATNSQLQGAVYFPKATLKVTGGGNLNGGGTCMILVAGGINVANDSGGIGTSCSSLSSGSLASVALAQ